MIEVTGPFLPSRAHAGAGRLAGLAVTAVALLTLACASSKAQSDQEAEQTGVVEAVLELSERWKEAYTRGDADAAAALMTEDALYGPTAGEVVRGRGQIREALRRELGVSRDLRTDEVLETRQSEDLAYLVARYDLRIVHSDRLLEPDTTTEVVTGREVAVFRRDLRGDWRIEALLFSRDPAQH